MRRLSIHSTAAAAFVLCGAPAMGQFGYWDLFSVSMLDDAYWNKVDFGDPTYPGTVRDQDPLPQLGGVMDWWGGNDWWWADAPQPPVPSLENRAIGGSLFSSNQFLNVILDTATLCDADELFPSWGEVTELRVTQFTPGGQRVLVPGIDYTWTRSPLDSESTFQIDLPTSSTSFALAPNDVNDNNSNAFLPNGPRETQASRIYGFVAVLPAGFSYQVDYDVDWWTWDSYVGPCYTPPPRFIPAPGTVMIGALGLACIARRRRNA